MTFWLCEGMEGNNTGNYACLRKHPPELVDVHASVMRVSTWEARQQDRRTSFVTSKTDQPLCLLLLFLSSLHFDTAAIGSQKRGDAIGALAYSNAPAVQGHMSFIAHNALPITLRLTQGYDISNTAKI